MRIARLLLPALLCVGCDPSSSPPASDARSAPAPMALLRGRYRYRLLLNARRSAEVQDVIRQWLGALDFPGGVRVAVDIDPYSFV